MDLGPAKDFDLLSNDHMRRVFTTYCYRLFTKKGLHFKTFMK